MQNQGTVSFDEREFSTSSRVDGRAPAAFTVPAISLATLLNRHAGGSVDLMKVDVEGAEEALLCGHEALMMACQEDLPATRSDVTSPIVTLFPLAASPLADQGSGFESELFGHDKGAYTGATGERPIRPRSWRPSRGDRGPTGRPPAPRPGAGGRRSDYPGPARSRL